jgi:hypothetical protein
MMIQCPNCGYEGKPLRGSGHGCAEMLILLFLFCFFIIPGIFYLVYLIARPTPISCPMCRYRHVVRLPDPPKPLKIKKSRVKRDPLLTPDGSINSDFFLKPKPSLLERIAKATGLTKQQIGILSGLALAVLFVLCFGGYIVIGDEMSYRRALWTPTPTPTNTPTWLKYVKTPAPHRTPTPKRIEKSLKWKVDNRNEDLSRVYVIRGQRIEIMEPYDDMINKLGPPLDKNTEPDPTYSGSWIAEFIYEDYTCLVCRSGERYYVWDIYPNK